MYLKTIEVYGFKSFANKIIFDFQHGITGIVGPNGSGKSNVADAVRWVLGEQSAKQLRGSKMEDVIFSGTENRKPLGSAYVAITLDNSDQKLPISYKEVTVARRVYRSGESEYLLNGTACRLRDIQELFFDTGIGKEGYSIIGQGQIDKILSGRPEDRRELFDEAAGIVKYKKNKAEAEKSLEAERQNLSRVNDILAELEKQVGPLERQSQKAKQYLVFRDRLKLLETNWFLVEMKKKGEERKEVEKKLEIVQTELEEVREKYEKAKFEYEQVEKQIQQLQEKIDQMKEELHERTLLKERIEGQKKVLQEQIHALDARVEQVLEVRESLEESIKEKEQSKQELERQLEVQKQEFCDREGMREAILHQSEEDSKRLAKWQEKKDVERRKLDKLLEEQTSVKEKVSRYHVMIEQISYRRTELNQRLLTLKQQEEEQKASFEQKKQALEKNQREEEKVRETYAVVREKLKSNQNLTRANDQALQRLKGELQITSTKLDTLRNITERYEGYGNSIRRVMERKQSIHGIIGVVADIIQVEQKYEMAIEIALGGSIQNIVTDNEETAKEMISYLKKNRYGRATFLPLTSIKRRERGVREEVLREEGVIGVASGLISIESCYQNLAQYLLGRIVVVDQIDHAIELARKYHHSLRIVTLEGESFQPGGAMTGGAFRNSSNLLGRRREMQQFTHQIEKTKAELEEAKGRRENLREIFETLAVQEKELLQREQKQKLESKELRVWLEQLNSSMKEGEKQKLSLDREQRELQEQLRILEKDQQELLEDHEDTQGSKEEILRKIEKLEEQMKEVTEQKREKEEKMISLQLECQSISQRQEFMRENISRLKEEIQRAGQDKIQQEKFGQEFQKERGFLESDIEECQRRSGLIEKEIIEQKKKQQVEIQKKAEFFEKQKQCLEEREELNAQNMRLDKEEYRLKNAQEKIIQMMADLKQYIWDQYELTSVQASGMKLEEEMSYTAMKSEISSTKKQMKELGNVNIHAVEEYKAVSERYEFLKSQYDDIKKAESHLMGIVKELDISMRKQFHEKFKEIKDMFHIVFKELFGGGKGTVELLDDTDVLQSGIQIIAQPPGKKLQNMMQLSGGEKALTAIALLFAIQNLKPSPFCLLDEIEAALDDSNVDRFSNYLHKLTEHTQFIIITHRRGTMLAADVLYGITMQEKGVSTLISVDLIEKDLEK